MDIMLHEFGRYVRDDRRTALFARAIANTVRPGDVVVDLGAGFGLLSMLCVRYGAARVYAIEQGPYVELGQAITRDNGMAGKITWVAGNSAQVNLPEQVDVIVSETLGQWALEEYTVEYLHDALLRFGKTGARLIPQNLELAVVPVSAPRLRHAWADEYGDQWTDVYGFNLNRLCQAVFHNAVTPYAPIRLNDVELLAPPVRLTYFQLDTAASSRFARGITAHCTQAGLCDGWLGLFRATLAQGIVLSTWPGEQPTHWGNVLFPLSPPAPVTPNDTLCASFGFRGTGGWSFKAMRAPST